MNATLTCADPVRVINGAGDHDRADTTVCLVRLWDGTTKAVAIPSAAAWVLRRKVLLADDVD